MVLSTRQRTALGLLLTQGYGDMTLGEIGSKVGVSGRTIARELGRVAPSLRQTYGLVLAGKSGLGLRIIGEPDKIRDCLADIESDRHRELGADGRRRLLALLLIETDDVIKLLSLGTELHSSAQAVRHDLEELRPWLETNGLSLSLRKGVGVILGGAEECKRQAIAALIMDEFGEAGILDLVRSDLSADPISAESPVREEALGLVPPALFKDAESALSEVPRREMLSLAPRDYLGLVIHLAVCAARKDDGYELEAAVPDGSYGAADEPMHVAALALESLARKTGLKFGPAELHSTCQYLMGAKPERPGAAFLGEIDMAALAGLKDFIGACGEAYGHPFSDDPVLRDGLAAHWGPALYRLRNRLPIRNPLLGQIRSKYSELFDSIRSAADRVFPDLALPDDEIGYLAMHFGSSLERRSKAGGRFRALVVCSAGIGSARMLASRIKAELPEIDIVASLSWFDIRGIDRDACDLLVSTIPLPIPQEEYILVSPLLPSDGIAALKAFMESRRKTISTSPEYTDRPGEEGRFDDMKAMNERLAAAIELLEKFRVFGPDGSPGEEVEWKAFLERAVGRCVKAGLLENPAIVLRDLEQRSRDWGIMLPGSSLLFLHARSPGLSRASITVHVLGEAPAAHEAPWKRRPTRLILMLAPPDLGQGTHDVLNEISSSFLEPSAVETLETGDEALVRKYYTRLLDRYARTGTAQGV